MGNLEPTPEWNWTVDDTTKTTEGPAGAGTEYLLSPLTRHFEA